MSPPERAATVGLTPSSPVEVRASSLVSAAGQGLTAFARALRDRRSALTPNSFTRTPLATWVGRVAALDDAQAQAKWLNDWPVWDSRATHLAWLGLQADGFSAQVQAACQRHGAQRVALVLGTSASTIGASERAYRQLDVDGAFPAPLRHQALNTLHAVAQFVQQVLGVAGPCVTVSTACSSSAKAFAQAQRWLQLGLADAVVVGGVDVLSDSLLFGFHALQLLASGPCQPFSPQSDQKGISVGEAAGFVLLERAAPAVDAVCLLGHGEANDAFHMSSPHPYGLGAELALNAALARAKVDAAAVDLVQLHGTGTALNDAVESSLVARCYAPQVATQAVKGCVGHTMGAAGMVGALACVLALREDPVVPAGGGHRLAASHAFGFGGNNAVLIFGRPA